MTRNFFVEKVNGVFESGTNSHRLVLSLEVDNMDRNGEINWVKQSKVRLELYQEALDEIAKAYQLYLKGEMDIIKNYIDNFKLAAAGEE